MNDKNTIIQQLVETGMWSKSAAERGFASGFKCAYCDRDLLSSVNDYKAWQEDHIVPLSAGGVDEDSNIVISCRTCNVNVKSTWDPRTRCGYNATREQLINTVRDYVSEKRTQYLHDVSVFRGIVYSN